MTLTFRLRQASQDLHALAERSGLMPQLLRSQLSGAHYAVLLCNLQAIYTALEQGLADAIPGFDFTPLLRSRAIAQDLAHLPAPADLALCAATQDYVQRLEGLAAERSPLLLAHAYLRYLGDLHGGQLLRRCVARLLQGNGVDGLQFYDFGSPERVAELIESLRDGLNRLPLDSQQVDAMAQEVRLGFGLHIDLFNQLPHA